MKWKDNILKKQMILPIFFGNKGNGSGIYRMLGFKNLDNASTKRLIVYGVGNDYLEINPNVFPLKADPTEYNKMKCISVHYDRETYPLTSDNSRIFCNGKLIKKFTSAQVTSGLSTLIFGGSNKTVTNDRVTDCFQGKIAFIGIQLHKKMREKEILINHVALCQKFSVVLMNLLSIICKISPKALLAVSLQ